MSVVAPDRLKERVEQYARKHPDASLPEILGRFRLDPDENSEERALVEEILDCEGDPDAPRGAGEQGGAKA